ncbi:hypothetical protein PVAG01_06920 [Phlyctema vagabunda]|uniref:Spherulin-4 n=1 Tax=Phlyctema vagabunda TaxID=108571 RepID=A0ABR4PHE6_9HELO
MKPFVVLPLYIYPTDGSWDVLFAALASHPKLRFVIIINPSSGPGSPPNPDSDYVSAISKLRMYSNVDLLGYVHVTYATRPVALVQEDIDIYAGWRSYPGSRIHMDGIFFDEAPSKYPGGDYHYMQSVASYAKQKLGGTVMLNPGVAVDEAYYEISDLVIACENTYQDYSGTPLDDLDHSTRHRTCVLVHHFMGTVKDQEGFLTSLIRQQIGGIFISTEEYDSWSELWSDFCVVIASH